MEIIEDFFSKSDQNLIDKARTHLHSKKTHSRLISKIHGRYEDLIAELSKELDDVPDMISIDSETYPICGIYTLEGEIILSGQSKYEVDANSLAIPRKKVEFAEPSTSSLIFLVNNPKWGYAKNLLAELIGRGIPEIMVMIFSILEWKDLHNLYRSNSAVLLFLQRSRLSSKFWEDYWKKSYGTVLPENPWKTLVQMNDEISRVGEYDYRYRERAIYIKYNVTRKFLPSYHHDSDGIIIAFEYDSLEVFKMINFEFEDSLTSRGIGPNCLDYLLKEYPEEAESILSIVYRNTLNSAYHKEMIIYMLNNYHVRFVDSELNKAFNHLSAGETELFFSKLFNWPNWTASRQFNLRILESGKMPSIYIDKLLYLFAIPEYYEKVEKLRMNKIVILEDIYRNPDFTKWLIVNKGYKVSPGYSLKYPIFSWRVIRVLEETDTKKLFDPTILGGRKDSDDE